MHASSRSPGRLLHVERVASLVGSVPRALAPHEAKPVIFIAMTQINFALLLLVSEGVLICVRRLQHIVLDGIFIHVKRIVNGKSNPLVLLYPRMLQCIVSNGTGVWVRLQ